MLACSPFEAGTRAWLRVKLSCSLWSLNSICPFTFVYWRGRCSDFVFQTPICIKMCWNLFESVASEFPVALTRLSASWSNVQSAAVIFLCFKMTLISEQVSVSLFLNVSSSVHQRRSSEVGGDSSLLINQTNIPDEPHTEEFYTRYLLIDLRGRSEVVSCRCPNANSSWSIAEGAGFTW